MSILVMSAMFKTPFGSASRKMVAVRLADFADDEGRGIWPSVDTIAEQCEISPRTVQRILADFVDEGILICRAKGGGRATSRYDFNLDKVRALKVVAVADAGSVDPESVPEGEGCHRVTGDTDDMRGDMVSPLGCHGDGGTVNEPSIEPTEEREARERDAFAGGKGADGERGQGGEIPDPETVPGTADFEKRVMRLCNGRGFAAGPWPDWDTSSPGWIGNQFAKLDEGDRQAAESWRDAYLRDIATRRKKPVRVGIFLRDRIWEGLDPELLLRAQKAAEQGAKPAEIAKPDGWAPARGPVWAVAAFDVLISGVERPERAGSEAKFWFSANLEQAWPKLAGLHRMRGTVFPQWLHGLKERVEFVPKDSAEWAGWVAEFERLNWPLMLIGQAERGAYFPKGGPPGLEEFERALAMSKQEAAA